MTQRNHYFLVCVNRRPDGEPRGSCAARGSEELYRELKGRLAESGLAKVEARACSTSCLDLCAEGPCILVEPEHFVYGKVQVSDLGEVIEALRDGKRVERLVVAASAPPAMKPRQGE